MTKPTDKYVEELCETLPYAIDKNGSLHEESAKIQIREALQKHRTEVLELAAKELRRHSKRYREDDNKLAHANKKSWNQAISYFAKAIRNLKEGI